MKKQNAKWMTATLTMLSVAALTACGQDEGSSRGLRPDPEPTKEQMQTEPETTKPADDPDSPVTYNDGATHVDNVKDLLLAIEPGADIVLEPGTYNLSKYIELAKGDVNENGWVYLYDCGDGKEARIANVSDLTIRGLDGEHTEIVIEPREAQVLTFESCDNVTLENLTLGHTVSTDPCEGDVLDLINCSDIALNGMDLYGCGTNGIYGRQIYGLHVTDSVIHDCSQGGIFLSNSSDIVFENSTFRGIEGDDLISNLGADMLFEGCSFQDNDTTNVVYNISGSTLFCACEFGSTESIAFRDDLAFNNSIVYDQGCKFTTTMDKMPVKVSNVEELLDAIEPGAMIIMEPGTYDISGYLEDAAEQFGENWYKAYSYVSVNPEYDGPELVIQDVSGLSITGSSNDCSDTKILTDPRYVAVMRFESCEDIALANLTMGHTDRGDCSGNVLDLYYCGDVTLTNMDLFGCGVLGIYGEQCTGNLNCYDSNIHDCSAGPLSAWECEKRWTFISCSLIDSLSGGFFDETDDFKLSFYDCLFGDKESENYMFRGDTTTYDCEWGEIGTYPDYGDDYMPPEYMMPMEFHPDELSVAPFDEAVLDDTYWQGFTVIDEDTGETSEIEMSVEFWSEGDGMITEFDDVTRFTWECDSKYSAVLYDASGDTFGKLTLYYDKESNEGTLWMYLQTNGSDVWFY